jgi:hypothetical protein
MDSGPRGVVVSLCHVRLTQARAQERSEVLVDVTGLEPATPCLQSTRLCCNNSTRAVAVPHRPGIGNSGYRGREYS